MSRPYVRAHEPMLLEWLNKTYPTGSWRTNVRLGKPEESIEGIARTVSERRMMSILLHLADAVVILPNEVIILEVATSPKVEKVCQLKLYGHLFGVTEEYREHWNKRRTLIVLSTEDSDLLQWFARNEGVKWVVYRPVWWESHVASRQARKYRPSAVRVPEGDQT